MRLSASELNAVTRALAKEQERRRCGRLHAFVKAAWPVLEPGRPFIDGWHLEAVASHLEAVSRGDIRLLIINVPPRSTKSTTVSVCWTPWEWGPGGAPESRFLYSSYAGSLAIRDSLKARRLIQSPWYQELWGHCFEFAGDQNAKGRFENDCTGYRLASSVGGLGTGEGGKYIVSDDPHNVVESESDAVRASTVDWWRESMSTRLDDPKTGAHVIVMQRTHAQDVSGYELKEQADEFKRGEAVHLMLPAEFEPARRCVTMVKGKEFFRDPRKKEGELLCAERFGPRELTRLKTRLGSYGAAGQLQQRPAPAGGGLFKRSWFPLWPADAPIPKLEFVIQSYDTACTDQTRNDPTAFEAWGIFWHEMRGCHCALLLDCWQEWMMYPALRRKARAEFKTAYGPDDEKVPGRGARRADVVLIEDKSSGISLRQDLFAAGVPAAPFNPGHADKTARASIASPIAELKLFYLPESKINPGKPRDWAEPFLEALEVFPNSDDDHMVDAFTQMARYVRDAGWIVLDPPEEIKERDYHGEKRAGNPYG